MWFAIIKYIKSRSINSAWKYLNSDTCNNPVYFSMEKTQMLLWPRLDTRRNLPVAWTVILPHVFNEFGKAGGIVLIVWISSKHCSGGWCRDPSKSETVRHYITIIKETLKSRFNFQIYSAPGWKNHKIIPLFSMDAIMCSAFSLLNRKTATSDANSFTT